MPPLLLFAIGLGQTGVVSPTIELRGRIREGLAASELTVGADGIVEKCDPASFTYNNVLRPPDLCAAYPAGARYSAPTTFKGKPQRRKIRIRISTYEENISG
ncbi:MAG: hypothetical protein EOP60_13865 [Sphingomonadales bacterium]|nr:MAG: hypothetical protein EOP60_13865 [Sphingomonadales bacterium]